MDDVPLRLAVAVAFILLCAGLIVLGDYIDEWLDREESEDV